MKLNQRAYEHARRLIREGRTVLDERDDWGDFQDVHRCGVLAAESFSNGASWREL